MSISALTHIDLFSGIGGFALAAQWAGFTTVAYVEIEPYAQAIIKQNFGAVADAGCQRDQQPGKYGNVVDAARESESKGNQRQRRRHAARNSGEAVAHTKTQRLEGRDNWKERLPTKSNGFLSTGSGQSILFGDIRDFDGTAYRGATLVTGGFPCQPFSQAGKRRGKEDDRYLWPEMLRVIHESKPAWVLGENVAGIVTMELDRVLSDLEGEGYAVQTLIIPACAVDAKHRRYRAWIVAHTDRGGFDSRRSSKSRCAGRRAFATDSSEDVAEDDRGRSKISQGRKRGEIGGGAQPARWLAEPDVGRVAHGIPARMDRLKGLGNAIVPQVAYEIIKEIAKIERA